jgi:hypothetical protein
LLRRSIAEANEGEIGRSKCSWDEPGPPVYGETFHPRDRRNEPFGICAVIVIALWLSANYLFRSAPAVAKINIFVVLVVGLKPVEAAAAGAGR